MIDCEFDTLILSLVLIWIFYVFSFNLQLSTDYKSIISIFYNYISHRLWLVGKELQRLQLQRLHWLQLESYVSPPFIGIAY